MEKLKNKVDAVKARTQTEKVLKEAVLYLLDQAPKAVELEEPVSKNNKDVLVEFARENEIEVSDPQNKEDYVEAIENYLAK